ncbi:D-3-phosphoglycerate dehydrogenase, D-isomer-specific 2-hydroxy acid dehydrogenase superfamily [Phaffia rhodozyma]|uniref:D-3-phosphoglycerate dehydrogenase, D-isomer-specific 2-hydroxy acid dehydrogenase superfamily n=1 Tax=Phaffia rhodozyma TaxID=264483 RepID=A0A0F7SSJ9_PHARH|nr:D-3-phosphoglycerate dehydrogenase, D-isomer-specific 2-hydroxy acid dehydrogenase superfamily [Phaffia rhodozyma]
MSDSDSQTVLILAELSHLSLCKVREEFSTVHYHPFSGDLSSVAFSKEILSTIDVVFLDHNVSLLRAIRSFEETPKLQYLQLCTSGADKAIASSAFSRTNNNVTLCNVSGIHTLSIPTYVLSTVLAVYHRLPTQILIARQEARWATEGEVMRDQKSSYYVRNIRGKTVGLLGYGRIARETARLFKSLGTKIIAANSNGKRRDECGYTIPGTGDDDGSIPSEYFSTEDPLSLKSFVSRSDVLIASLPSTDKTTHLLTEELMAMLPKGAVFVNVGRGTLVDSDVLLKVLDGHNPTLNLILDVTDPEPLPQGHPLYTHDRVIVTPHLSGNAEGEMDLATDILIENARRRKEGLGLTNIVDIEKGY